MTQISKSAFNTTYADSAGTFSDNTTRAISEGDMRQFSQDIKDSCLFVLDTNLSQIVSTKVTISSAEILALNATPKTLVAAQGAGTIIDVISCQMFIDYNTIQYATNTNLYISYNASGSELNNTAVSIASGAFDYFTRFVLDSQDYFGPAVRENTPLIAYVSGGNPTAGNSPIYMYVTYRVITL